VEERLVFGYGARRADTQVPASAGRGVPDRAPVAMEPVAVADPRRTRETNDWGYFGLLAFTAVLYMRPQDQLPGLSTIPFAEITAIIGLSAMLFGRIQRGLSLTRVTPELIAVGLFGFVMLLTAPFSIWPGGSVQAFTDVFVKVFLIYLLMVNTLTTPERLHKFMTIVVIASGYLSTRAMFDYVRGVNLVENGRVQGAIGGMFKNPNDMALNMVAVLPLCVLLGIRAKTKFGSLLCVFAGLTMIGAIIASQSRGGFVGLAMMVLILGIQLARRKPAAVGAGALVLLMALPFAPSSYWERMASITDSSKDAHGSREARRILLGEAWATFLRFPLHGVGAQQFANYNPPERVETWRETHNVVLQVAAELGILGLAVFGFLLWRAFTAGRVTRRLLRQGAGTSPPAWQVALGKRRDPPLISRARAESVDAHAGAMTAAIIGWFVCALFASVAYSWTFYYLLALATAPHGILIQELREKKAARGVQPGERAEARI
jgi:putative inorganic carbon (hco3(-)) transporter